MNALVTGAEGSIGRALVRALRMRGGAYVFEVDAATGFDILDRERLAAQMAVIDPRVIFHLAGAKHAPDAELDPWPTVRANIEGTRNVLDVAPREALVITASTCKAADPETVYGASKLLAERMTLGAGGSVARFYNVRESSGNVFRLWESLAPHEPLPVTPCWRYFVGIEQAVHLLLRTAELHPGRYTIDPGAPVSMEEVARALYPGRPLKLVGARRGDRVVEPRHAASEWLEPVAEGIEQIHSRHDAPRPQAQEVAA